MRCLPPSSANPPRYLGQYLGQGWAWHFGDQDVARSHPGELAFAVHHTRRARSPADACRVTPESGVRLPNLIWCVVGFYMQWSGLEEF
ncbi:MAG: hypothetical protein CM1200mP36_03450 [Gammaproteobacteria bacterium]|nr:MAG: hypothetical protein CM1200mP36_03450 [Gammaproteobacteria bacterium]